MRPGELRFGDFEWTRAIRSWPRHEVWCEPCGWMGSDDECEHEYIPPSWCNPPEYYTYCPHCHAQPYVASVGEPEFYAPFKGKRRKAFANKQLYLRRRNDPTTP